MFIHPNIAEARPLLVVGLPRSGTRFVANALNRHPDIHINGEIPREAMDCAERFLRNSDLTFARRVQRRGEAEAVGWHRGRHHLLYAIWGGLVKRNGMSEPNGPVTWYGYKTPTHDCYWRFYRDFLGDHGPKYVFCVRDFVGYHISREAVGEPSIQGSAQQYREGVNRYAEMKAELGEDVSLFVLNDVKDGGIEYIRERLFDHFGIAIDDRTLQGIDPTKQANSSKSKGVHGRELTKEEREFLSANMDLERGLEAAKAGKRLWTLSEGSDQH